MVRLGIGMYGISNHLTLAPYLQPVLQWKSRVSQVKMVKKGESVGYGQTFQATEDLHIATIPVGYADGFRRSLSNGQGGVFIKGIYCPTVGRVCMDMVMVQLPNNTINEGEEVEIIGENQTLNDLAKAMNTIPYEVLTSISKRVHRSYSEEA
jgi:alanine racemase